MRSIILSQSLLPAIRITLWFTISSSISFWIEITELLSYWVVVVSKHSKLFFYKELTLCIHNFCLSLTYFLPAIRNPFIRTSPNKAQNQNSPFTTILFTNKLANYNPKWIGGSNIGFLWILFYFFNIKKNVFTWLFGRKRRISPFLRVNW